MRNFIKVNKYYNKMWKSVALFGSLSLVFCLLCAGAQATKITFTNNCSATLWPGTLTADQKPQLSTTGFVLHSKASTSIAVQAPWIGRFWARTQCTTDASEKFICKTADCVSGQVSCKGNGPVPPVSLVEINIAVNSGKDFYNVNLVNGFNLPISIATQGGTGDCQPSTCPTDVNDVCPAKLQVKDSHGSVIACKTYPTTNYSMIFEKNNIFTCSNTPNYVITFCS